VKYDNTRALILYLVQYKASYFIENVKNLEISETMCRVTAENYNPPLKDFISEVNKGKGKVIPLQARCGPEGG